MKNAVLGTILAGLTAFSAPTAQAKPNLEAKVASVSLEKNPYCKKKGYECNAKGWDIPEYTHTEPKKVRKKKEDGHEITYRAFKNLAGPNFITLETKNGVFAIDVYTKPLETFLDTDCDGKYEVKITKGNSYDIPKCAIPKRH